MSEPCTVIISAPERLDALRERAGTDSEILTFSDRDVLEALETISIRRPRIVALERLFAATSRGAALMNRIKADPSLSAAEIRVVAHDGSYSRVSARRTPPAGSIGTAATGSGATTAKVAAVTPASTPAAALDYRGTRRAKRFTMADGTQAQVDGAAARIVDLSVMGAQIVSPTTLRPQQRVRVTLLDQARAVRFSAAVAWAAFEIPKSAPRYRAGLEFTNAQALAVEAFCKRHQRR